MSQRPPVLLESRGTSTSAEDPVVKPSNSSLGLIAGLLAAALSATPSSADFLSPSENALLGTYVVCNQKNSRRIASQEGDPIALAMAARGMCQSEEFNLERALVRSFGSTRGTKILDRFRKLSFESNVTLIVSDRADALSFRDCKDHKHLDLAIRACTDLISRIQKTQLSTSCALSCFATLGIGTGCRRP